MAPQPGGGSPDAHASPPVGQPRSLTLTPTLPTLTTPLPCPPQVETLAQKALVGVAVTYMLLIVIIPFLNVFVQAFSHGLGPFVETLQEADFQQARGLGRTGRVGQRHASAWLCFLPLCMFPTMHECVA